MEAPEVPGKSGKCDDVRGRTVIGACLALAVVMSSWAWWHHLQSTNDAAAFWGTSGAEQLVHARRVIASRLDPDLDEPVAEPVGVAGRVIRWRRDVSAVPGLVHLRHALTQDRNYRWAAPTHNAPPQWTLALEFGEPEDALVTVFDPEQGLIGKLDDDGSIEAVDCQPMAAVLREYFEKVGWE